MAVSFDYAAILEGVIIRGKGARFKRKGAGR
jgi:hypothetical protein